MKNIYENNFKKWEEKKRKKLGDSVFLEKYIKTYKSYDKSIKILFPIVTALCLLIMVWRITIFLMTYSYDQLLFAGVAFMLFATWVMLTEMYFLFISKNLYGNIIERWKKELENINKTDK